MTFDERRNLRNAISVIQTRKEATARKMHVVTTFGTKLYLGGDCRPRDEQSRVGYPQSQLQED